MCYDFVHSKEQMDRVLHWESAGWHSCIYRKRTGEWKNSSADKAALEYEVFCYSEQSQKCPCVLFSLSGYF